MISLPQEDSSMRKYSSISGLAWMIVGILFCRGSVGIGLGDLNEPGPGFFPFLMSGCLILFSFIHFVSSLRIPKGQQSNVATFETFPFERNGFKRLLIVIAALLAFTIAMDYVGFVLTTFLFIFLILKFVDPQRWSTVLLVATLTTCLSYAIFQLWLKADLPGGFLGF